MAELIFAVFLGILAGTITGLVPGIHVNTIVFLTFAFLPYIKNYFSAHEIAAFFIAMAHVHSYVDYIPSIFFGAPNDDSSLSVLPGHKLLLMGRGYEAVRLTAIGGLGASFISIMLFPVIYLAIGLIYENIRAIVVFVLAFFIFYMILREKGEKKIFAFLALLFSSILGVIVLNSDFIEAEKAFFPIFTGLFGISTLLISMRKHAKIPEQSFDYEKISMQAPLISGSIGGIFSGFLPALSSSEIAGIMQSIFGKGDERSFLAAIGAINTAEAIYAIFSLYLINRARSGAAVGVKQILGTIGERELYLIISVFLFTSFFAVLITLSTAKIFARKIKNVNYRNLAAFIIFFLFILTPALSGAKGLFLLILSTFIGLIPILAGVNRTTCMGVLMLPTLLYYLFTA